MDDVPILDRARLELITHSNSALACELLEALFEEADRLLEQLTTLLPDGDRFAVSDVAHTIKGGAAELGAMRLRTAAAALEVETASEHWPNHIGDICAALAELRTHVGAK